MSESHRPMNGPALETHLKKHGVIPTPQRLEIAEVLFRRPQHMSADQSRTNKFDYLGVDLVVLKKALHRWQAALAETGWNSLYWNNHDQPRVVSRFGDDDPEYWAASAKALATVLHGMRGVTDRPHRRDRDAADQKADDCCDRGHHAQVADDRVGTGAWVRAHREPL